MTRFSLAIDLEALAGNRRKSVVNRALKESLAAAAKAWHQEYYEDHFTATGFRKYSYTPRKGQNLPRGSKAFWRSYSGRKLRSKGHLDPLKFTGTTYRLGKVARIVATRKQGKVVLPRGLNRKHPNSDVDMREEATRVLPSEAAHLREIVEAEFLRRLQTT